MSKLQSTHFSVENICVFFFLLPLYRIFLKSYGKMHQTEIRKAHGPPASAGVTIPLTLDQQSVQPAAPICSLSQASYAGGGGGRGRSSGGGLGGVGGLRGIH